MYKVKALIILNFMDYVCAKLGRSKKWTLWPIYTSTRPREACNSFNIRVRKKWWSWGWIFNCLWLEHQNQRWRPPHRDDNCHVPKMARPSLCDRWDVGYIIFPVATSMTNAMLNAMCTFYSFFSIFPSFCFVSSSKAFSRTCTLKQGKYHKITIEMIIKGW